ncbi:MAG: 16S rRNA (cytosine(1402)-N(4))-methyltransferase RsmH [Halieaceae bacterium]|nr:16S rRNA (cytosine(1402)-N(4))-methyltransferase RsmH [Halieaceae bacterium]
MHQTVLLREAVEALVTARDGYYVDGTFGRGGHSREILAALSAEGKLLGVDKDPQAIEVARQLKEGDDRFDFEHGSFAQLPHQLRRKGIGAVDGILLDLGVSSPQLDEAERGFSFSQDGPLDMRMDTTQGQTAAEWLAAASHGDIASVLREYGEERHAGRIASAILRALESAPIETTGRLAQIVSEANPSWEKHKHPATRSFQGIRIWINRELADLELLLDEVVDLLRPGGRLVIISFHSLEDRMVKRFIRRMSRGEQPPRGVPVMESQVKKKLAAVGRAVKPAAEEVAANPRARSAVMRVAERLPEMAA